MELQWQPRMAGAFTDPAQRATVMGMAGANQARAKMTKDSNSINTLRLVRSAIKDRLISLRGKQDNLSDSEVLSILQNLIEQE